MRAVRVLYVYLLTYLRLYIYIYILVKLIALTWATMEFRVCNSIPITRRFFTILRNEFLGATTCYTDVAREELLAMKCCSFERKDLEKHFDRMSR